MEIPVRAVAYIRNDRSEALDDNWNDIVSTVELASDVPSEALQGLADFSHVEIVFFADWADDVPPGPWHRHPRGNAQWPDVGVFAQRNKDRPNRILLTTVAIESLGERSLVVRGLDGIDGTPVLDIKPVFRWSVPRGALRVPEWSEALGENYF
ncbi:MAG TPA: TrmO family methyltransferase [Acidimicrobiales bacterium]|nr:TrmO family methyltransferase [Acidimicrobiales bacterium]